MINQSSDLGPYEVFLVILFVFLMTVYPLFYLYFDKKKRGRLDPDKTFWQNLWDAVYP